jgi:hypothetical protein
MMHRAGLRILLSVLLSGCGGSTVRPSHQNSGGASSDGGPGGASSEGGSGGASSEGGTGDVGGNVPTEKPPMVCPAVPPRAGEMCTTGLRCSYGDDPRVGCRPRFSCDGTWASAGEDNCPTLLDCSSLAAPPKDHDRCEMVGADCSTGPRYCRCETCTSCAGPSIWICTQPPAAPCPPVMPNDGAACEPPGLSCSYGACPVPGGVMTCVENRWKQTAGGCPSGAH